jgi:hypothetical protein
MIKINRKKTALDLSLFEVDTKKKSCLCRTEPAGMRNIALCVDGITDSEEFKTNGLSYGSVIRQR